MTFSATQAGIDLGEDDPFAGDINFGLLANETGGKLFYNRNNLGMEIKESEQMGSQYYTLTYQPLSVDPDGKFRRVRVTPRVVQAIRGCTRFRVRQTILPRPEVATATLPD